MLRKNDKKYNEYRATVLTVIMDNDNMAMRNPVESPLSSVLVDAFPDCGENS